MAAYGWIFIDDTDPAIVYGGNWISQAFTNANNTLVPSPLYGTLHTLNGSQSGSLSYTFQGTQIFARLNAQTIPESLLCTVDGVNGRLYTDIGTVECSNNQTLQAGSHQLLLQVADANDSPIMFDGILVEPTQEATTGDVLFELENGNIEENNPAPNQGVTLVDFSFIGYSTGFYLDFQFFNGDATHTSLNVSYTIDDHTPFNYTMIAPPATQNNPVSRQLVLQTPRLPLGQHRIHVELSDNDFTIDPEFIVQNTTSSVDLGLEVIPPVSLSWASASVPASTAPTSQPTSGASSAHPRGKPNHLGVIIGCAAVAVVLLLVIGALCWLRRRKDAEQRVSVWPFQYQPLSEHQNPEKRPSKADRRGIFGVLRRPTAREHVPSTDMENIQLVARSRIRIHEDSGNPVPQPVDNGDVGTVEFPPTYDTIGSRNRAMSRTRV